MSWFSEYVGDPLKALLAKAVAMGDAELAALAGQVAAKLPAAPVTATAETAFETVLTSGFDALVTSVVGPVPVVGQTLAAEAVTAGNAAIDYGVAKGAAALNALAAAAKAKLAALAEPPGTKPAAAGAQGPGSVTSAGVAG